MPLRWVAAAMFAVGGAIGSGVPDLGPSASLIAAEAAWTTDANCPPSRSVPYCPPNPHVVPLGVGPNHAGPRHAGPNRGVPQRHASPPQFAPHPMPVPMPGQADPFRDDARGNMTPNQTGPLADSMNPPQSSGANDPTFEPPVQSPDGNSGDADGIAPPPANATDNATPDTAANNNFNNVNASDFQSNFASAQSSFSSSPTVIGDFAGGGFAQFNTTIVQQYEIYAEGTGGSAPVFDVLPTGGNFPDAQSIMGSGSDLSGDSNDDTFNLAEPLPPTDAPTAPGQGFVYQGGTATFVGASPTGTAAVDGIYSNGDNWFLSYSYAQQLGGGGGSSNITAARPVPSPGVSVRRIKISENFSPEVRNRFFLNYNFFNDALGGLGDISRFVMGMEQVLVEDMFSVEMRLPVAATYASEQVLEDVADRDMEVGNFTILGKLMLFRNDNISWSAGMGVGTPTADDTEIEFNGADLIEIQNKSVQIQPFTGVLFRRGDWVFQSYMQLDIAAGGDPVLVNSNLVNPSRGKLEEIGEFRDSTLMHLDVSMHRVLYDNTRAKWLSTVVGNAELHYTGTLEDSDIVSGNNFNFTNLARNFNIVNATFGTHLVCGKGRNVIITPAMAIPLRDGLDEQFDYEAIVQLNYIR